MGVFRTPSPAGLPRVSRPHEISSYFFVFPPAPSLLLRVTQAAPEGRGKCEAGPCSQETVTHHAPWFLGLLDDVTTATSCCRSPGRLAGWRGKASHDCTTGNLNEHLTGGQCASLATHHRPPAICSALPPPAAAAKAWLVPVLCCSPCSMLTTNKALLNALVILVSAWVVWSGT